MKTTRRQFGSLAIGAAACMAGIGALATTAKPAKAEKPDAKIATAWKEMRVGGSLMRVYTAGPEAPSGKVPGILILQEAFGVNRHIRNVAERFASLGYVAYAPDLYHRTSQGFEGDYENSQPSMQQMKLMTDDGLIQDLQATYALITRDPRVDASRIASSGYCMGGRASFMANAVLPLKAAIAYYGGRIAPDLLPRAMEQHGPILLFWGGKDQHVGQEQPRAVADALRAAGKVYADVTFSEAEHGFFCDVRKSWNPDAAKESWALATAFLTDHL